MRRFMSSHRAWPSVRHVKNKCSINIMCHHGTILPRGCFLQERIFALVYTVLAKVPLVLTAPFSETSYCEPAPKPEIPWAVCFPFVHMLTTTSEKPLDEAST